METQNPLQFGARINDPDQSRTADANPGNIAQAGSDANAIAMSIRPAPLDREQQDALSQRESDVLDKVAEIASAGSALSTSAQRLKLAQQRVVENCRVAVRRNPVTALGLAVAAGFLFTRLFRR